MAVDMANQGAMNVGLPGLSSFKTDWGTTNYGNTHTYRGLFSDWFNSEGIAEEDYRRGEISADNQLKRDLYFQEQANKFNAEEAQKKRDWDEYMERTYYTRAVEGMKEAGLNPVLALGGNHSTSSGAVASSSGGRSSANNPGAKGKSFGGSTELVTAIVSALAGAYNVGATNATRQSVARLYTSVKKKK